MKFNLKMIAVAAAMVSAGAAHAGFVSGALAGTTGDSTLALLAWNTSTGAFYIRDTGFTMNSFLPNDGLGITPSGEITPAYDKTPSSGLVLSKGNTSAFADSAFSTWLGTTTAADVRWSVLAGDRLGTATTNRFRETVAVASGSTLAPVSNGSIDNGLTVLNGFSSLTFGLSTSGSLSGAQLTAANGLFINQTGFATALGADADLYYFTRSTNSGSSANATNALQFGNATGYAKFNLASNGDLTYTVPAAASVSAVPVPAAAWLFGSGLLSFGAFVRRRTAK